MSQLRVGLGSHGRVDADSCETFDDRCLVSPDKTLAGAGLQGTHQNISPEDLWGLGSEQTPAVDCCSDSAGLQLFDCIDHRSAENGSIISIYRSDRCRYIVDRNDRPSPIVNQNQIHIIGTICQTCGDRLLTTGSPGDPRDALEVLQSLGNGFEPILRQCHSQTVEPRAEQALESPLQEWLTSHFDELLGCIATEPLATTTGGHQAPYLQLRVVASQENPWSKSS